MRHALAILAAALPLSATAQDGGTVLQFEAGLGVQSAPLYFGSDETETGVTGSFSFGCFERGSIRLGCDDTPGWGLTGSVRVVGERPGVFEDVPDDIAIDPLFTYDTVDPAIELGGGLAYTAPDVEAFAVIRRGFGGHEGWVAEAGADLVLPATDRLTLRAGPRLLAADDTFMDTYFATGAGFLGTGAYDPDGGLVSAGVQLSARYDVTDAWAVTGTARYDQLLDDAAASPITQSTDQTTLSLVVSRAFDLRF